MRNRTAMSLSIIVIGIFIASFSSQRASAQSEFSVTFYGDPSCSTCINRENVVRSFVSMHPEVNATYMLRLYYSNTTLLLEVLAYLGELSNESASIPAVVLNNTGTISVWFEGSITITNLEAWLEGRSCDENGLWVAFLAGLLVGIAPCLLLMTSVLGTTLVTVGERRKYLEICTGLILGIISAYVVISIIFLGFLSVVGLFVYFKYIFAGVLIALGIWQIVEFKREKSVIFGTPTKVKSILRSFIEKQSGMHAFLLGLLFAFVKTPCFGGIFLSLLYDAWLNPLLLYYIIIYFCGMLLPLIILLIALRVGFQPSTVNTFLEKYRPYLRMISGAVLILLSIYLVLFS